MRRAARTDANHQDIVKWFRRLGWSFVSTHQVGDGFPDGVAGKHRVNVLVEIKDGTKPPSAQRLTPAEESFHRAWRGMPVEIITSCEDVVALDRRIGTGLRSARGAGDAEEARRSRASNSDRETRSEAHQ